MAKLDTRALQVESFEVVPDPSAEAADNQLAPGDPISTWEAPCPTNFLC